MKKVEENKKENYPDLCARNPELLKDLPTEMKTMDFYFDTIMYMRLLQLKFGTNQEKLLADIQSVLRDIPKEMRDINMNTGIIAIVMMHEDELIALIEKHGIGQDAPKKPKKLSMKGILTGSTCEKTEERNDGLSFSDIVKQNK